MIVDEPVMNAYLVYCVERFLVFTAWVLPAGAMDPSTYPSSLYMSCQRHSCPHPTGMLALAWLVMRSSNRQPRERTDKQREWDSAYEGS